MLCCVTAPRTGCGAFYGHGPRDFALCLAAWPYFGFADRLMSVMGKWIDEFRLSWRGISPPSPLLGGGFAAGCLALSTAARWGLALVRPDVFFTPYFPAVVFATAFGGY